MQHLIKYKTEKCEYKDAEEGLLKLFSDIVELETQCKFSDCLHETEPGCAVKKAIRDEKLSNKRLESYRKLQREMLAVERKKNPKLAEKKKWKEIRKIVKEIKKHLKIDTDNYFNQIQPPHLPIRIFFI